MIDENKLIDDLIRCRELGRKSCEIVGEIISNQPKIGTLIPIEEKLPDDFEDVLVFYKAQIDGGTHDGEEVHGYGVGYLVSKTWNFATVKHIRTYPQEVIAWMPLPEISKK